MTRTVRTDWQATNAAGRVLYTFSDRETGRAWVKDNAHRHDGLILEEVTILARRVYRPRTVRRPDPFAIPAYGAAA